VNIRALPLLLSLLAVTAAYSLGYLGNEDFWWYLASGDAIVERGEIPARDVFLYTSPERATWVTTSVVQHTWVTHSWLWTVILSLLDRTLGLWSVAVFSALCVAALVTLIFTRADLDRFGLANGAIAALALVASIDRFTPRSELASCLLLVVALVLLERSRPLRWRSVALLAAVQWLWSNLHGGYVLGIFAGLSYGVGGFLQGRCAARGAKPRGSEGAAAPSAAPLLWLGPILCLASIATPALGIERLQSAIAFVRQLGTTAVGAAASPIDEWQRTYASGFDQLAWLHAAFVCLGAMSFAVQRPPRSLARFLVFAGTALLGITAKRFVSVFAIATAVVALANLAAIRPALSVRFHWCRRPWARALHALATAAACAFLLSTAAALWISRDALGAREPGASFVTVRPEFSAPGAAEYIRRHDLPGPIFNEIALGGYLVHALYPDYQLFIDTRNLSEAVLDDYRKAVVSPKAWRALQQRYGFRTAVLSNLTFAPLRLRRLLADDPEWRLVFVDPQASVFLRAEREPPPSEYAFSGRYGAGAAPFLPPSGWGPQRRMRRFGLAYLREYLRSLSELGLFEAVERLAGEGLAAEPGDAALLEFRGFARLRRGKPKLAVGDYREVVAQTPDNVRARIGYARALYRAGRAEAALLQLEKAQQLEPANDVVPELRARIEREILGRRHGRGEALRLPRRAPEVDTPAGRRRD
jgi:tetratricopeptide (TPR) repeat protein